MRSQSATPPLPPSRNTPWRLATLSAGLLPFLLSRKRRDWLTRTLMLGVLVLIVGVVASCGGGS
ncbi:MAG: hypothetical protein ACLGSD_11020, partial [Acidobacteriota bacterium]